MIPDLRGAVLSPEVVALVNELPNVDRQNEEIIGRLFVHGGLGHAHKGPDSVMRQSIRVPEGQFMWKPAIVVMPEPGELEIEFSNDDPVSHHAALVPSNGDKQIVMLPVHTRGKAKVRLDGPGYYWFGCPVSNHAGRGMLGLILVRGNTPKHARLDRPEQPRP
jgi:PQQ system protein